MNLLTLRRLAVQVLVVFVALAAVLTSGAPAQSLGELARRDQGRPKSGSGKVYTNDDLKGAPAPATTPAPPAASAPATSAPSTSAPSDGAKSADGKADDKADAKGDEPKSDAASWRKRVKELQDSIDRSKLFADSLQSRINGLTNDFSSRDDPAQRSVVAGDRQKALTELDRVKKEIQLQQKALTDLQEEARKSGVPPGWLR